LLASRLGNDRYMERGMNTFNSPVIAKSVQTTRINLVERSAMATVWDMADTFQAAQDNEDLDVKAMDAVSPVDMTQTKTRSQRHTPHLQPDDGGPIEPSSRVMMPDLSLIVDPVNNSLAGTTDTTGLGTSNTAKDTMVSNSESDLFGFRYSVVSQTSPFPATLDILALPKLTKDICRMERALNINTYYEKLLKYESLHLRTIMNLTALERSDTDPSSTGFKAAGFTAASTVVTTDDNSAGQTTGGKKSANSRSQGSMSQARGVQTPSNQPKTTVSTTPGMDKAIVNPDLQLLWRYQSSLTKVGMFSGVIFVFDVRKNDPMPVIDTTHATGRHLGAVRKLQWVVRQSGRAENLSEVLVSVSTDGRVTEWSVRKGFDSTDLMVLKRSYVSAPGTVNKPKRNESLISRTAFGSCMAFNKREPSIYVVGTEDGPIHKCSCSYNEQYLDTFLGHTAPVYQIEWSPFISDVFLSCSADWTIKLWHLDQQHPLINIQTNIVRVYAQYGLLRM
ncbi:uncharacterized protein DEA37_0000510, partial [Paragonimus westermani]